MVAVAVLVRDFTPGMSAITGSTARSVGNTRFRIVITDELTDEKKTISGDARRLRWWQ